MKISKKDYRICTRGIWDSTVPGITFDEDGVSNYAKMFDKLCEVFPEGEEGKKYWENIVDKMKERGKGRKYDCIIGVSGGTDSSYLMYIAKKEYGLRPLAVNLDNGWSSEIAVQNIKKVTKALDIDLETYVIDYEEVKAVLRAYMKASLPWVDGPTDNAIKAVLFSIAEREKVKFVISGSDFRSEGKQPSEWTYTDSKQMLYLVKKFEKIHLNTFPYQTLFDKVRSPIIKRIMDYAPLNYLKYQKITAREFLKKEFNWEYYGGHHHENIFTRFAIAYWMPKKFGIDKRIITLSAQILNGELTREAALERMKKPPYDPEQMERDREFVMKKLDLTNEEFQRIWNQKNKYYWNYPSFMPLFNRFYRTFKVLLKVFYPTLPSIIVEKDIREDENIN